VTLQGGNKQWKAVTTICFVYKQANAQIYNIVLIIVVYCLAY